MKKLFLLTFSLCAVFFAQAQTPATVTTTAGNLRADLVAVMGGDETKLPTITDLKINGTLNQQDFADIKSGGSSRRIRSNVLKSLDLSGVTAIEGGRIPKDAFYQFSVLESLALPPSGVLTTIGEGAFSQTALTQVAIPEGVTTLEATSFYDCRSLASVDLPSTLQTLGRQAFSITPYGTGLTEITLPEGLVTIGISALANQKQLTHLTIPASVEEIAAGAFNGLQNAETITFAPRNGKPIRIGTFRTFMNNAKLVSIEFPENTTMYLNEAYPDLAALGSTFAYCASLKEVRNLPAGITEIGQDTYRGTGFQRIEVPEGVTTIGNSAFRDSPALTEVVFPNTVTQIGSWVFMGNPVLTSVKLGNSVESIGEKTFSGVATIETLELPATVTAIGESAFENMTGLKTLIVNNPEPVIFSTQKNVFTGIDKENCILYVPASAVQDYKDFDLWNTFLDIRAIGSDAAGQTIDNFNDIMTIVGAVVELNATASSGLPVTYEIADESIATLTGNTLTILKEGKTTITAKQAGDNIEYGPIQKVITLSVVNLDWLEVPTIMVSGNTAKVVGPATSVENFTRFYINDAEVEQTGNSVNLTGQTGELILKATTADGAEVIRLTITR